MQAAPSCSARAGWSRRHEDLVNEANRVAGAPDSSSRHREKDDAS
jgi:hypothetical protein